MQLYQESDQKKIAGVINDYTREREMWSIYLMAVGEWRVIIFFLNFEQLKLKNIFVK